MKRRHVKDEVSHDDAFALAVTKETNEVGATTEEPVVLVSINRIHKDALVDSGSVSNLISLNEFNELKAQGLKASLTNYQKKLFAYGRKRLKVLGQFEAELSVDNEKVESHFVVTFCCH